MTDAEKAYAAAVDEIGRVLEAGEAQLKLGQREFHALDRLPPEIALLKDLISLDLDNTQVSDLTPLAKLTALQSLRLNSTQVSDLTPLAKLTALEILCLHNTQGSDLTPLAKLTALETLWLDDTQVSDLTLLAKLTALQSLTLSNTQFSDFTPLAKLTALQTLWLSNTQVSDLTILAKLTALQTLLLFNTNVSDLTPLAKLTALRILSLDSTHVSDLRPVLNLQQLVEGCGGLSFTLTPFAGANDETRRLAAIENDQQRVRETMAYLKTLPPWPEPLPWEDSDPEDIFPPLTLKAILSAQTPVGWRFLATAGAMVIHVDETPLSMLQTQLCQMAQQRTADLCGRLRGANSGLRGQVSVEADRFTSILADDSRPLSIRSVELWGTLVAMGGHLDANDAGRAQGRDPLDLLSIEQRSALQTLLQIAGNLVRSFPDVKALDDSAGGFMRREVTPELVAALIEAALRAAFVEGNSAALMQHVAGVARNSGAQGEKAASVSTFGIGNLIKAAALVIKSGGKVAGAAVLGTATGGGMVTGRAVAEHYDLGQAAISFIEEIRNPVTPLLDNLPPDEGAELRALLADVRAILDERGK
jgi:hypothetical protein